ncbi:leucine rich adaptor protein 1 [Hypomesus transpacificus]|uniref:leucine rich adaptor protein 1 n=1 Tax=Hypomesus transpacificus TaxID=137520 RepID=UPI001F0839E9|nr:leucine rich adaptor protein 1 [Hypomesus transpacificus]
MDEGTVSESIPDLKDIEVKIGRKTPEGLLKWMREEASSHRGDAKLNSHEPKDSDTGRKSLDEKIRKLKVDMAHLRSVDVKILQQLLAVHEGIEAVKWLLEERSTLTSRCSSLTSSQYSLGEGPDTSWRGSWSSLQDPNDKLDNISIGSYLDTLADDMDEYCPSSSESVLCTNTLASDTISRTMGGAGGKVGAGAGAGAGSVGKVGAGTGVKVGAGAGTGAGSADKIGAGAGVKVGAGVGAGAGVKVAAVSGAGAKVGQETKAGTGENAGTVGTSRASTSSSAGTGPVAGTNSGTGRISAKGAGPSSPQVESKPPKDASPVWTKATEAVKRNPITKDTGLKQPGKSNGVMERASRPAGGPGTARTCLADRLGNSQSPKLKPYKNGKVDLEGCKMNGKMHLEYDAHWRWVQSQDDVTFL